MAPRWTLISAILLASALGTTAWADAQQGAGAPAMGAAADPLPSTALRDQYGAGAPGVQAIVSDQLLQAADTGNAVVAQGSVSSGALSISSGALNNFNGVGNFVMNTGANNTLQGSITINISMPPK